MYLMIFEESKTKTLFKELLIAIAIFVVSLLLIWFVIANDCEAVEGIVSQYDGSWYLEERRALVVARNRLNEEFSVVVPIEYLEQ